MLKVGLSVIWLAIVGASAQYSLKCDSAFCRIIDDSNKEISQLKLSIDDGVCVSKFGEKADKICNQALERFASEISATTDDTEQMDPDNEAIYDKKTEDLEKQLDAPLHVLYLKQLNLIREKALKAFTNDLVKEGTEFEAMMQANELFQNEAEESTRSNPEWSYAREISGLKATFHDLAARTRRIQAVKDQAQKQTSSMQQFLQQQQQQLAAIKEQMMTGGSPWNIALAYRVPDTNINLVGRYQQGRANVQVSCLPDESAGMGGENGFVHGVTPGNVGVSFNINI